MTNRDTSPQGTISFLDALGGRGVGEIAPTDSIDIQGKVILDEVAGPTVRCAALRIGAGPENRLGGALYIRKTELEVEGDIAVSAPVGTSADLHVEWQGLLRWAGRIEVAGAGGVLAWAGARSLEGGSLVLDGGTLRFKVQTREVVDRVFTPSRTALITLDGQFSTSGDAAVHLLLEQAAQEIALPAGEFVLLRSEKMTGELPRLVVDGGAEQQRDKLSLKSEDNSLILVVGGEE